MIDLAPPSPERVDYDTAWLHCATLTHDNKYDWRLPTHAEYIHYLNLIGWHDSVNMPELPNNWEFYVIPVRTNND
jgi:hypothetical protein